MVLEDRYGRGQPTRSSLSAIRESNELGSKKDTRRPRAFYFAGKVYRMRSAQYDKKEKGTLYLIPIYDVTNQPIGKID
jgi:hypothetical protein